MSASYLRLFLHRLTGGWRPYFEPTVAKGKVAELMTDASIPTVAYFFLLTLSGAIATFGLLANSAPAIIGAMIIAPLMTPIMGLAYGLIQWHWAQIARSFLTLTTGVVVVIAIGYVSVGIIDIQVTGSEMVNRSLPTLLDLGVAVAAGAAGGFSFSRESIRNSVAGVAIAVALVPPLGVVGVGLAMGDSATADVGLSLQEVGLFDRGEDIAVGAFVLFLTNLAAIIIAAGLVMTLQGYGQWRRALVGLLVVCLSSVLLLQPLQDELRKLQIKSQVLHLFKTLPSLYPGVYEHPVRLDVLRVRYEGEQLVIHLEGMMKRSRMVGARERMNRVMGDIERLVGEPVVFEMEVIPVDVLYIDFPSPGVKEWPLASDANQVEK